MKEFLKKHLGLIIVLICVLIFPTSLDVQARLNMRVIVTGLAVDYDDGEFEVTAQYVKTTSETTSGATSAEVSFLSDKADSVQNAISKLSYKEGKVAAFSHAKFIILGKNVAMQNANDCLDFFIRSKIIENSSLILVSEDKAKDDIKKTKDMELSVGVGLQKVFLFKEQQSDGLMTTVADFMKYNLARSKTVPVSTLKFDEDNEQSQGGGEQSGSGEQAQQSQQQKKEVYFSTKTPVVCFVDGKEKCKLTSPEEIDGFMFVNPSSTRGTLLVKNVDLEKGTASVGINIKGKRETIKVRYENEIPVADIYIDIDNSELVEVSGVGVVKDISKQEYDEIIDKIKKQVENSVSKCFETTQNARADVFKIYDKAYKFQFEKTSKYFESMEEFLAKLKINVVVSVNRLEY